jgi:hypothetical protein
MAADNKKLYFLSEVVILVIYNKINMGKYEQNNKYTDIFHSGSEVSNIINTNKENRLQSFKHFFYIAEVFPITRNLSSHYRAVLRSTRARVGPGRSGAVPWNSFKGNGVNGVKQWRRSLTASGT